VGSLRKMFHRTAGIEWDKRASAGRGGRGWDVVACGIEVAGSIRLNSTVLFFFLSFIFSSDVLLYLHICIFSKMQRT
jgi:hypothetical protein